MSSKTRGMTSWAPESLRSIQHLVGEERLLCSDLPGWDMPLHLKCSPPASVQPVPKGKTTQAKCIYLECMLYNKHFNDCDFFTWGLVKFCTSSDWPLCSFLRLLGLCEAWETSPDWECFMAVLWLSLCKKKKTLTVISDAVSSAVSRRFYFRSVV